MDLDVHLKSSDAGPGAPASSVSASVCQHSRWQSVVTCVLLLYFRAPIPVHPRESIFCFLYKLCPVLVTSWARPSVGTNRWNFSGIFHTLVAFVCWPPFLSSHPSWLYSIGNQVKYFQGLTLEGPLKSSTNSFWLPLKAQVYRADR